MQQISQQKYDSSRMYYHGSNTPGLMASLRPTVRSGETVPLL